MILIATPTRDNVSAGFAYDLVRLAKDRPDTEFTMSLGSIISNNRLNLARLAVDGGYSHLLFIDSDMRFPYDTIDRLLEHDKDIIGANCRQRTQDEWTARKNGKFISSKGKKGIQEVDTLGFGVTLINTEVFKKLNYPWFFMPFDKRENKLVGEDIYFCTVAKENGFKVWVDHDLSQEVKHARSVEL